jgi:hypothetical protein
MESQDAAFVIFNELLHLLSVMNSEAVGGCLCEQPLQPLHLGFRFKHHPP